MARRRRSRSRRRSTSRSRSKTKQSQMKRSPKGFLNFVQSMRALLPNTSNSQRLKDLEALWKEMSIDDKRPYERLSRSASPEKANPECSSRRGRSRSGRSRRRRSSRRSSRHKGSCR